MIKQAYLEEMKENRTREDSGDLFELPPKKRGRQVLLGDDLDQKVQLYLKKVSEEESYQHGLQWLLLGGLS